MALNEIFNALAPDSKRISLVKKTTHIGTSRSILCSFASDFWRAKEIKDGTVSRRVARDLDVGQVFIVVALRCCSGGASSRVVPWHGIFIWRLHSLRLASVYRAWPCQLRSFLDLQCRRGKCIRTCAHSAPHRRDLSFSLSLSLVQRILRVSACIRRDRSYVIPLRCLFDRYFFVVFSTKGSHSKKQQILYVYSNPPQVDFKYI